MKNPIVSIVGSGSINTQIIDALKHASLGKITLVCTPEQKKEVAFLLARTKETENDTQFCLEVLNGIEVINDVNPPTYVFSLLKGVNFNKPIKNKMEYHDFKPRKSKNSHFKKI